MTPIISVAPMMDRTDRHARYLYRVISPSVRLYTEMITTKALIHGNRDHLLGFNPGENYLALQLGGCDPKELSLCTKYAEDYGYDEVNLNVGCPSSRVKAAQFGACLMLKSDLVAECVYAMQSVTHLPITVKCRIGVDDHDDYEFLYRFIEKIAQTGCKTIVLHARKALLNGLSPKENREIPPLCYETVYRIKKAFPDLTIIINGGITSVDDIKRHAEHVDGCMIGREAYLNPYILADIHRALYNSSVKSRAQILLEYSHYIHEQLARGIRLHSITRHMLGLFHQQPGARLWRRHLSENACKDQAGWQVVAQGLSMIPM